MLGPAKLIGTNPEYDGHNNGWEVNPVVEGGHGFQDYGRGDAFDPSLVPAYPYITNQKNRIESIVKTIPTGKARPFIKLAVVLTAVTEIPEGNGEFLFRPPYVSTEKPYFSTKDIRTDLLPDDYEPVANTPSIEVLAERFRRVRLDHKTKLVGEAMHPEDAMFNYHPDNAVEICGAALRLMMTDSIEDKMPLLINYLQYGIDMIYTMYAGQTWPDGGGHSPCHRLTPAFTAVLLDMEDAKEFLQKADFFHSTMYFTVNEDGFTLWGGSKLPYLKTKQYWAYVINKGANQSIADPYGYIDGGRTTDGNYQVITSESHKGEMLATHLMPVLKEAWNEEEWKSISSYADRWVCFGAWSLPDPVAPFDGNEANYMITYGYDEETGLPIEGDGRYPTAHGMMRDYGRGGAKNNKFLAAMWNTYRAKAPGAETTPPYAAIISPYDGRTVAGVKTLQTTAYGIHGIASVQYYLDGNAIGAPVTMAQTESPFAYELSFDFATVNIGKHTLYAVATDKKGNTYQSKTLEIQSDGGTRPGDMNGDGKVDLSDVTFLAKNIGKTNKDADWQQIKLADMNGDGKIGILDLVTVAAKQFKRQ